MPQSAGKASAEEAKDMFTVILMEGNVPKRAIGQFDTKAEAEAWAIADGWERSQYRVIPFHP